MTNPPRMPSQCGGLFLAAKNSPVPDAVDGLQLNFCRTPACVNYGIPPWQRSHYKADLPLDDGYRKTGGRSSLKVLKCIHCTHTFLPKSNQAALEELNRFRSFLTPDIWACPNMECANARQPFSSFPDAYASHGKTTSGAQRSG